MLTAGVSDSLVKGNHTACRMAPGHESVHSLLSSTYSIVELGPIIWLTTKAVSAVYRKEPWKVSSHNDAESNPCCT